MKVRSYRNNVEHTLPVKGLSISTGELSDSIRNAVGNKIFNVQFIKKNGNERNMTCRLNVTSHCGNNKPTVDQKKYLVAYEITEKQYRNINVETILWLKIDGVKWLFDRKSNLEDVSLDCFMYENNNNKKKNTDDI